MAAQVAGVEFIAISTMGCKLWELGYSDTDILAIKLLIKNILLTSFLVSRFYLQRYINLEPLLKWTLLGMALIMAWLPCLKAYPVSYVMLMCLHTFLLTIGPINSIPILATQLFDGNARALLFGPNIYTYPLTFYNLTCQLMGYNTNYKMYHFTCYYPALLFAWIIYKEARGGADRRVAWEAQEDALAAIEHLN